MPAPSAVIQWRIMLKKLDKIAHKTTESDYNVMQRLKNAMDGIFRFTVWRKIELAKTV